MFSDKIDVSDYFVDGLLRIALGGDVHEDNPCSDTSSFNKFLRLDIPKILMGDLNEGILANDKRFHTDNHSENAMQSLSRMEKKLKRSNGPIIGLLRGNHEDTIFKKIGNYYRHQLKDDDGKLIPEYGGMCERLDIRYLGVVAYLILYNGRYKTTWQLSHPNKGSISYRTGEQKRIEANKKIRSKAIQSHVTKADAYFCGHYHQLIVSEPDYRTKLVYDYRKKKMVMKQVCIDPCWYGVTGSFLRTYVDGIDSSYSENALYEPTDIGWLEVVLNEKMEILRVEIVYAHGDRNAI